MHQKSLLFADHTRTELAAVADTALVVFPVGATEQHGPHLPVGTDFFTVEHLAHAAATLIADRVPVLIAPTLAFGCSEHHLPFGGTLSLSTEVYYRVLCDVVRSAALAGFRKIFLLNGHGGNHELIQLAARDMALAHPIQVGAASYWNLAWDRLVALDAHTGARLPGHAGRFETSLMLALHQGLVNPDRPHRDQAAGSDPRASAGPYRTERHGSWQSIDGYTDSPANATEPLGRQYLPVLIEGIAKALIEFAQ